MIVIVSMTGVTACGDEARSTSSSARDVIELNEWRPSEILPNTDGSVLAILGRTTGHKQGITLDLGKTDLAPDKQIVSVAWLSNDRLAAGEWIADSNTSAIIELTVAGDSKGVHAVPWLLGLGALEISPDHRFVIFSATDPANLGGSTALHWLNLASDVSGTIADTEGDTVVGFVDDTHLIIHTAAPSTGTADPEPSVLSSLELSFAEGHPTIIGRTTFSDCDEGVADAAVDRTSSTTAYSCVSSQSALDLRVRRGDTAPTHREVDTGGYLVGLTEGGSGAYVSNGVSGATSATVTTVAIQ